tara:strand:+ start:620 stop:769 length:150 start_codon:yes stop_codon:yes gene_type:complete
MRILVPVLGYIRKDYGNHREYPHGKYKFRKKNKIDSNFSTSFKYIVFDG